jgi:glucokinase
MGSMTAPVLVLGGDTGGTKTHLGLYRAARGELSLVRDRMYATTAYPSLEAVLLDFIAVGPGAEGSVAAACFGVPGPIIDGVSHATNVPWDMRESSLSAGLNGAPTMLVNDLEATAYGVKYLTAAELRVLQAGEVRGGRAHIAVIAAGTGLGEGALVALADGRAQAVATEGGHCDFAPRGAEQIALLQFLAHEFGHVSVERVLSGPGLHNIYRFLLAQGGDPASDWLQERMSEEDPSAAISAAALAARDARCVRALEIFAEIYGAEASNLALKYMALGGVYVCGGIAPKVLPFLERGGFIRAFLDKGRLGATLARIPVRVSLNPSTALIGAAHVAASMA